MKKNKHRLEDIDDSLFTKNDKNGNALYFLNQDFTLPFNGEIFVVFNGIIESEAEYENGAKNGLEYIYGLKGNLEQINENRSNLIFGISKEFDENKILKTVSIVYNNDYLKIIDLENGKMKKIEDYHGKYGDSLPEHLKKLLKLSNLELINYSFEEDKTDLY